MPAVQIVGSSTAQLLHQSGGLLHRHAIIDLALFQPAFRAAAIYLHKAVMTRLIIANHRARIGRAHVSIELGHGLAVFIQQHRPKKKGLPQLIHFIGDLLMVDLRRLERYHLARAVNQAQVALGILGFAQDIAIGHHPAGGKILAVIACQRHHGVVILGDHAHLGLRFLPLAASKAALQAIHRAQVNIRHIHIGVILPEARNLNVEILALIQFLPDDGVFPFSQEFVGKLFRKIRRLLLSALRQGAARQHHQAQQRGQHSFDMHKAIIHPFPVLHQVTKG